MLERNEYTDYIDYLINFSNTELGIKMVETAEFNYKIICIVLMFRRLFCTQSHGLFRKVFELSKGKELYNKRICTTMPEYMDALTMNPCYYYGEVGAHYASTIVESILNSSINKCDIGKAIGFYEEMLKYIKLNYDNKLK
jgi:hypothetical protein